MFLQIIHLIKMDNILFLKPSNNNSGGYAYLLCKRLHCRFIEYAYIKERLKHIIRNQSLCCISISFTFISFWCFALSSQVSLYDMPNLME